MIQRDLEVKRKLEINYFNLLHKTKGLGFWSVCVCFFEGCWLESRKQKMKYNSIRRMLKSLVSLAEIM